METQMPSKSMPSEHSRCTNRESKNLLLYFTLTSKLIQIMQGKLVNIISKINMISAGPDSQKILE